MARTGLGAASPFSARLQPVLDSRGKNTAVTKGQTKNDRLVSASVRRQVAPAAFYMHQRE